MLFRSKHLSIIPGVSAVINLVLYVVVIPRLTRHSEEKKLSAALGISVIGSVIFLLVPAGSYLMLYLSTSVLAIGQFIMQTYRDAVFMNRVGEHEKADMFAAVQTLTTLASIPAGWIAGYAYSKSPVLPFILVLLLFLMSLVTAHNLYIRSRGPVQEKHMAA